MKKITEMDKNLKELLAFINGEIFPCSKGIWTHTRMSESQTKLHSGLLELEKLGKVKRCNEKKDFVCWMPIEEVAPLIRK